MVFDDEVTGNLAVEGLQLERQVFITQLLLEGGIGPAGFAHHQAQHPEEKTKFHKLTDLAKVNGSRSLAILLGNATIAF